jgi:hypothetical protein
VITETDIRQLRGDAIQAHSRWKGELILADAIEGGEWEILWPDASVEHSKPLIENLYAEALEDKTLTASTVLPQLLTQPTRGTRKDRGESNAAKRQRVGLSYLERSDFRRNLRKIYRDYYHAGLAAGNPWATGFLGVELPPDQRFAYFQLQDPRAVFPLGWDNRGRLTAGLVMRRKRVADLKADWGEKHPALIDAQVRAAMRNSPLTWLEEIWYFDGTQWGVTIGDASIPYNYQGQPFGPKQGEGATIISWLAGPERHELGQCPLKAIARTTVNDQPRGALFDIIPQLRVAQNFMARLLDDLEMSIYAPTVADNIQNIEEYGPGAILIGDGQGKASLEQSRPPVNFEAQQTVKEIMEQTRRQAFEPAQRSGEAGASIVSAKGTTALMGSFNAELASAQFDSEILIADLLSATAALDEKRCFGRKEIWLIDKHSNLVDEAYDPAELFKGDWRFRVTYGDRTGLDEQQHLIRASTLRNLGAMSLRKFMEKMGIEDPLAEETDIAIEKLITIYTDVILPQEIQAGNKDALVDFIDKIDTDKMTVREAVFETIRAMKLDPAAEGASPGGLGAGGRADILRMVQSLGSGGIPGNAEGQPGTGGGSPLATGGLRQALGSQNARAIAEVAPGGTAT